MSEEEQQLQSGSGIKQEAAIKHRRKKEEIEKDFICGDPNCGRKYGTNAALYTHIKNKHNGVPPTGTVKPSTSKKTKEQTSMIDQVDDELSKSVATMNDPDFMKFTIMISNLGHFNDKNIIVRDSQEPCFQLEEEKLLDLYEKILKGSKLISETQGNSVFTKKAEMYLKFSSPIWKKHIINELYTVLIYAYIFRGENFDTIEKDITNNLASYKLFSELIKQDKVDQFREVYTTIWNFIT
ncbi:unnamed protein product [Paramecium pentaurelia]|uniref:C2H2-type domain-containing protein n=1 Tax=Paramecium pentaurelia TaxID=43138 RepID=A0A8S1TEV7_9CILI|nr:unnamed protein product [Paramecium pentaurelia]